MLRSSLHVLVLALLPLLFACGDDDDDAGGNGRTGDNVYTCTASTGVGTLDYRVNGDELTLTDPNTGDMLVGSREGNGNGLYDTWFMDSGSNGHFSFMLYFTFQQGSVRVRAECSAEYGEATGSSEVQAAASYTDTTISVLEAKENEELF